MEVESMAESKKRNSNRLHERMVRNDDIFCSLLFDSAHRTLRVVDFRGGNFQTKHNYLERVLAADGIRKVFTLIERDDMTGWQRVGYLREGTIPGYYKRSDAYIMSKIYDEDWEGAPESEEVPERKNLFNDIRALAKEMSEVQTCGLRAEHIAEEETLDLLKLERDRLLQKTPPTRGKAKGKGKGSAAASHIPPAVDELPLFRQFSREIEYHYFVCQNRHTKQLNMFGAEYQDCFGNAKVDVFFQPAAKTDYAIARHGLLSFIDWLLGIGAVTVFSLVRVDDLPLNALFASTGFRNTGYLNRQVIAEPGPVDQILWTKKLT
jgi:hypothetical protein